MRSNQTTRAQKSPAGAGRMGDLSLWNTRWVLPRACLSSGLRLDSEAPGSAPIFKSVKDRYSGWNRTPQGYLINKHFPHQNASDLKYPTSLQTSMFDVRRSLPSTYNPLSIRANSCPFVVPTASKAAGLPLPRYATSVALRRSSLLRVRLRVRVRPRVISTKNQQRSTPTPSKFDVQGSMFDVPYLPTFPP